MARTDDLWPGFRRAAATAFPTETAIELACAEATLHFKEEAERTPGTYVDLDYGVDYPVRNPVCRWEAASTAICRFEVTAVSWDLTDDERVEALRTRRSDAWEPNRARLVYVIGGLGTNRWIAARGCEPVRHEAP